ncbi:hypothetical protein PSN45_003016 [Yamadazyma tenuis]|uniref:Clavaminate synthase-like protein n=1 Tax=Candida tenuis (strain ATCC 10573 / BCRC 21748 / CBS 615 / JCM 9827 / NBRC 10315 / NRRL Y-1498 / VKM Y-70) TaxID=590646 RepID=G3AXI1_CANTC|nr:Clavaminate synthase-like protein [Yamadazyma tenuis ATCC 10573]EGV66387.1 Clavaminate synthase-like protein [Yamadazyma tenuis ATCC 10573]WEJ95496.1 hypothetical protein PSN45_003016 [Yamadazyma tenuis]
MTVDQPEYQGTYSGNRITLSKIELPNKHIVNGNEFPYALAFNHSGELLDDKVEFLKELGSNGTVEKLLAKHGAVLFRGAGSGSPETFSKLVSSVETARGLKPYEQIGLAGKRNLRAENVFTANEGPKTKRFYQHNEYSRFTIFPSNIHFFCQDAPKVGGDTPIAHSIEFFQRLQELYPEIIEKLSQKKLKSSQFYPSREGKISFKGNEFYWQDKDGFGHLIKEGDSEEEKRRKAEIMVRKLTSDFEWAEDGGLLVHQYVPFIRIHPESQLPTFFNTLVGRYGAKKDAGATEFPHVGTDGGYYAPLVYEDGEEIDKDLLEKVLQVSIDLEYNHEWQEGDLLLVDNIQVSHGRQPWSEGERVILVSMWDNDVIPEVYKA